MHVVRLHVAVRTINIDIKSGFYLSACVISICLMDISDLRFLCKFYIHII